MADIRSLDGKVRPTLSGPLADYIRDLKATGVYGERETDVVRTLVREGVRHAVTAGLIEARDYAPKKGRRQA